MQPYRMLLTYIMKIFIFYKKELQYIARKRKGCIFALWL